MKIVIEVSDTLMEYIVKGRDLSEEQNDEMALAIANGTPLPEHHGRLIDKLELSDHIKNRLIQTAMNNMEIIMPYSKVCTDIVDNRIDTWIDEVKTIIEGSESE